MNPFEAGIVGAGGFHAVMDRAIALKRSRVFQKKERNFFYNPMWGCFGDATPGPPGTYYYRGGMVSYFWNIFDQILIRPDLLEYYSDNQITVLENANNIELNPKSSNHSFICRL